MSWRDQYHAGSFRGVAFRTASHERSGGRRNVTFEFPGRDEPVVEDLGRRARQFSLECHVIGTDYTANRDQLIDALEEAGPGLLVHPWHGQMMVSVLDFTTTESTEDGGICWFRISFGEAGLQVTAPIAVASGELAASEADLQIAKAPGVFAGGFSIAGAAAFVEQSAADIVSGMAGISQLAAGLQGGLGPTLRAFETGLRFLPDNMARLLRDPLALGQSIVGLVQAVSVLGGSSRNRVAGLSKMVDWVPAQPVFPERTAQRVLETDNREALLRLFRVSAAAELARATAVLPFTSYEDAIAVRDALAERLDRLALASADAGDDAAADSFDALRRAAARDIAARGASLARVYGVELAITEPALAIAQRIYGPSGLETRLADIVGRNRVRHPGFVPGGRTIELLTVSAGLGATA